MSFTNAGGFFRSRRRGKLKGCQKNVKNRELSQVRHCRGEKSVNLLNLHSNCSSLSVILLPTKSEFNVRKEGKDVFFTNKTTDVEREKKRLRMEGKNENEQN